MSSGNATFHERNLVNFIAPQLLDNAAATSSWLPVSNSPRLTAIVQVGATDTTVDAKLQQATDSSGTGAKDITGAAITQIAGTGDNRFVSIDLATENLDLANGFDYVRLSITAGDGTTGAYAAAVIIQNARHMPPTQPAAYAEKVVVAGGGY
ncbi:MAG: hypothetical protein KDE24_05320 [Caldilinea sp.]|nr:hypothetical protein [Caldilinea sp.]